MRSNEQREQDNLHIYYLYVRAVQKGMDVDHAATCGAAVRERIESGRSMDCDEYRALVKYDQREEGSQS